MQPPLTECARKVLDQAQVEARGLNQEFVGTEHLLLALLKASNCHAARVMRAQHVDREAVRSSLLAEMPYAENPPVVSGNLPLSPKVQRAVNSSIVMARSLREPKVSTRVMLLALMDEQGTPFVAALRNAGVDVESLLKALAEKPHDDEA
ncbi:MAG TPA: Clp protease N-terminal domain-containing protein [Tepidisphaeraceae bacterium]|jgi:ATP-dependent Clp protease ATP-binding subunit ClpC